MHDIERYRGHSLILSKPRGRGHTPGRSPRRGVSQDYPPGPQQQQQGTATGAGTHMEAVSTGGAGSQCKVGYMMESNNGGGGSAGNLAGMPLFSLMPHRRGHHHNQHHHTGPRQHGHHQSLGASRHGAATSPGATSGIRGHRALPQHQDHHYHQQHHTYHSQHYTYSSYQHDHDDKSRQDSLGSSFDDCDDVDGLSLARLALGTPLIRGSQRGGQGRTSVKDGGGQQQENGTNVANTVGVSDAISVTSDEGSTGHADNTLPRIIKPRKRRKKDRKPTGGSTSPPPTAEPPTLSQQREQDDQAVSIVTLKPYMPMCFNYEAGTVNQDDGRRGCGQGGSRTCACSGCLSGHIFPTPPPSPASSSLASTMSSASSSCSSSSEDEALLAMRWDSHHGGSGGGRGPLVRSLSEPQATPPTLHITSSVGHSPFAHHRDLDIRLFRSDPRNVSPSFDGGHSAPRTRHWSVPAPGRPYVHSPSHSEPSRGTSVNSLTDSERQEYYKYQLRKVTTPHPPQRPWIPVGQPDRAKPSCIFTVLCYNVLCDKYATRQMYGYCPSWALEWEYRKKGIMDEVRNLCADIITLQEVETDQFYNFFLPELKADGYDGIFSPKSRAKHMAENERKFVDGCAVFWRTTKFSLVKDHLVEFNKLAMANHDGSEDMLNRVMTKDNIGLAALLETREAAWENSSVLPNKNQINQPVLVCTAHVHWDPEFCDVKLIQTIMLMSEVKAIMPKILEEARQSRPGLKIDAQNIHFLLCGDLNSLPESGVIEFLTKSCVSMDHEDFKGLEYKSSLLKWAPSRQSNTIGQNGQHIGYYTHAFKITTAIDFSIMPYTNYTYDFKGIIDYIFHSVDNMNCLGVLGPIEPDWFRENRIQGCPHPHIPSDHFPLLVQLELKIHGQNSSTSSSNSTNSSNSNSGNSQPNGLLHR